MNNNLEIIEEFKIRRSNGKFKYLLKVHCKLCEKDPQLFGDAIFTIDKFEFKIGNCPCGCSKVFKWSEEQNLIRVKRKADLKSYEFLGWSSDYAGGNTKILLSCQQHGTWSTTKISNFLNSETRGCPKCGSERAINRLKEINTLDDKVHITKFLETGLFHEGSIFEKSDQKDKLGREVYWKFTCGICKSPRIIQQGHLLNNKFNCGCDKEQRHAYINLISDYLGNPLAIKYGITKDPEYRISTQQYDCLFTLQNLVVYYFENTLDCKSAELEVSKHFKNKLFDRTLMRDGWTETTNLSNIFEIDKIFVDFGGKPLYKSDFYCYT